MKNTKFNVRKGGRVSTKHVQSYAEELLKIKNKHNKLTPKIVVKEAKKKSSTLHSYFEWDDSVAGEKFRLQQAMTLIGSIEETIMLKGKPAKIKSFFNVKGVKNENVYVTVKEVTQNNDYRTQLLNEIIMHMDNTTILMKTLRDLK